MDSLVWAMSVITPSEMMSRMKYCEPSVTADAYLAKWEVTGETSERENSWLQMKDAFHDEQIIYLFPGKKNLPSFLSSVLW